MRSALSTYLVAIGLAFAAAGLAPAQQPAMPAPGIPALNDPVDAADRPLPTVEQQAAKSPVAETVPPGLGLRAAPGVVCPPAGPGPTLFPLPDVCGDPCFPCQLHTYGCPEAPFWYFNVDAVGLARDADDDRAFAVLGEFDGVDTTSVIDRLDTDDLGHWFELGGSFTLGYVCTPRYGVEVSFLGAKPWDQSAALRDSDGNLFSPFSDFGNPPLAAFDNNDVAWIREYSALRSGEVSLRQRLEMPPIPLQTSLFYGVRYVRIDERFDYYTRADVTGDINFVDIEADNDLLGAQLGALFEFHIDPRWWIDVRMNAALMGNETTLGTHYQRTVAGVTEDFRGAVDDQEAAFLGELSLTFLYYMTPHCMTRIGYRALWIEGLATGARNFSSDVDTLELGPLDVDTDGGVVYHGPYLGLGFEW